MNIFLPVKYFLAGIGELFSTGGLFGCDGSRVPLKTMMRGI
jgi:hypothetical protein